MNRTESRRWISRSAFMITALALLLRLAFGATDRLPPHRISRVAPAKPSWKTYAVIALIWEGLLGVWISELVLVMHP